MYLAWSHDGFVDWVKVLDVSIMDGGQGLAYEWAGFRLRLECGLQWRLKLTVWSMRDRYRRIWSRLWLGRLTARMIDG